MIFGGYNPDRHEFDPLLQSWLYGGPTTATFWLPHNAEMAKSWCEHIGYSRQDGIRKLQEFNRGRDNRWRGSLIFNDKVYDIERFVISTARLSHEQISKLKTSPATDTLEAAGTMELARRGVQVMTDEDVDIINEAVGKASEFDEMDPALKELLKDLGLL